MEKEIYQFKKKQKVYLVFKRIFDVIIAIIALLILIIPFGIIAIIIKCSSKGPVFFRQERYGKDQKIFIMYKFRSMRVDAPIVAPSDISDKEQLNMEYKFGHFLRVSSIDELPQLFNILKGDLSFIGPRPGAAQNEEYLKEVRLSYTPSAFDVKPGLSGYAQTIMKRSHDPDKKAYYDHFYAENLSFKLDFKIFIGTILGLFGIYKGK